MKACGRRLLCFETSCAPYYRGKGCLEKKFINTKKRKEKAKTRREIERSKNGKRKRKRKQRNERRKKEKSEKQEKDCGKRSEGKG